MQTENALAGSAIDYLAATRALAQLTQPNQPPSKLMAEVENTERALKRMGRSAITRMPDPSSPAEAWHDLASLPDVRDGIEDMLNRLWVAMKQVEHIVQRRRPDLAARLERARRDHIYGLRRRVHEGMERQQETLNRLASTHVPTDRDRARADAAGAALRLYTRSVYDQSPLTEEQLLEEIGIVRGAA